MLATAFFVQQNIQCIMICVNVHRQFLKINNS